MSDVTRRTALRAAIGVPLAAVAACSSGQTAGTAGAGSASGTGTSTTGAAATAEQQVSTQSAAAKASLSQLAKQVKGTLVLPDAAGYAKAKQLFDPDFDNRRPAGVLQVKSADDVQAAVKFAHENGLRVTARSGGHSYVGASAAQGALVLDLRGLSGVEHKSGAQQATIGAGTKLYDVARTLDRSGVDIPHGTCPTVGVDGLTMGGGLGVASRAHGLTCDALVSAHVVLPDGTAVTADSRKNSDIFWALRGGGGGSVGIVTQWTFTVHKTTSQGSFTLDLPAKNPEKVLQGWAAWVQAAPRTQWANLHVSRTLSGLGLRAVGITGAGEQHAAAAALAKACGVTPTHSTFNERSNLATVEYLGGGKTSQRTAFTAGSDVIEKLDATSAAAVVRAVRHSPNGGTAVLDPLTGAVQDVKADATAFPYRSHVASVQWYTGSTSPSARRWLTQAHSDVARVTAGRYVNYVEAGTKVADYLGGNAARYAQLRRQRDPKSTLVTSLG